MDCRPTTADIEFAVDTFSVGSERADRDEELVCDLGTREAACQKSEHLQFALAERFEQRRLWGTVDQGRKGGGFRLLLLVSCLAC